MLQQYHMKIIPLLNLNHQSEGQMTVLYDISLGILLKKKFLIELLYSYFVLWKTNELHNEKVIFSVKDLPSCRI